MSAVVMSWKGRISIDDDFVRANVGIG